MAKQKVEVYERILECAKEEFLEKGFKDASLRVIAQKAGTSTSSIYTRFRDKEGVFNAIVSPVTEWFEKYFSNKIEDFQNIDVNRQDEVKVDYTGKCLREMIDYIYDYLDEFKLLLKCSYGTIYSDFIERLVDIEVVSTLKFIDDIGNDAIISGRVNKDFLHIINKAYFSGIFEVVLHYMNKDDALKYIKQLFDFYSAGHEKIYHP